LGWAAWALVALGFVGVFAEISATAASLPSRRTSAIAWRYSTMAQQVSLEASRGSSPSTAASTSWTAITLDAVRSREVLHPRDQAELARPPAETDQPAQIVRQVVDVLTNASLEVS
jgi:hypothetical protein